MSAVQTLSANRTFGHVAEQKHYTPQEIAVLWSVSTNTVRRMFRDEAGVLEFGSDETRWSRKRKVMRIPESVLRRVHEQLHCKAN